MNRYLKLVNFEFTRFWKLYLVLIGITIFSQLIGVIVESQNYVNRVNEMIYKKFMPKNEFIEQFGEISFLNIAETGWFIGSIGLCVVVLMIYVFFIWYRDWFGKTVFIYRLLMLPTARMHIYLAKATTILLFILGLVALRLVLFLVENQLFQWIVPNDFRVDLSIHEIMISPSSYLEILFPNTFIEFMLYYGGGMVAVLVVFTAILFERSFRIKGIIYGILYIVLSLVILLTPIIMDEFMLNNYFYPIELLWMEVGAGLIVLAGAICTGNVLIKNKVRV